MKEDSQNNFISKFEKRLNEVPNKEYLILNEIKQIEKTVSSDEPWQEYDDEPWREEEKHSVFSLSQRGSLVLFNSIYHHYLTYGEYASILGNGMMEDDSIVATVEEVVQFANYYNWLKSIDFNGNPKKSSKKDFSLTHKEKLLALHYLGLRFNKYENTKYARILSLIIDESEEATRQHLSNFHKTGNTIKKVKTGKGMNRLKSLFESLEFGEELKLVLKDLEQL